jgi:anti-sigma regulatory factor (Ser/Thr protein kinase)
VEMPALDPASAVRDARSRTAAALRRWRCQRERIDDVVLVVSEVVTNAVQHGAGVVLVRLLRRHFYVRIEVQDNSPKLPVLMAPPPTAERGRGVSIVRSLAARWGSRRVGGGKLVWAELPSGVDLGVDDAADEARSPPARPGGRPAA